MRNIIFVLRTVWLVITVGVLPGTGTPVAGSCTRASVGVELKDGFYYRSSEKSRTR